MNLSRLIWPFALGTLLLLGGCDDLFGSKSDPVTDEIFEAGRSEPGLFNEVEYVPLFPFYTQSGDGLALQAPHDVYVGYDELIYIVDDRGLHVIDVSGRPAAFIPIAGGATSVVQDRRFHVYVTATRDTVLSGQTWTLPVVMHFDGITTGSPTLTHIIWHPFDDDSRRFNRPDPIPTDEEVRFTGVAVLPDNSVYVSRAGPVNTVASIILPHNTLLHFTPEGINTEAILSLSSTEPSLRSAVNPSDVMTFVHPPQRARFATERHFVIAQKPAPGSRLPFAVLSIRAILTPDGYVYQPDTDKIQVAGLADRGDGFLYEEEKFDSPAGLAYSADGSNYLFVIDEGLDRLFVFTGTGVEGVAPPPGVSSSKPVVVSFGSTGDGALQFNGPQGVAYFNRIVYVADTGNNRLSRFRLNTDFE